jgi:quinol monooxygenase YgiN
MYLITSHMTCAAGREDDFIDAVRTVVLESRNEPGCLAYACSRDVLEPSQFVFVEQWEDGAAIRAHGAAPHVLAFMAAIDGALSDQTTLLHSVEKTRTL